MDVYNPYIPKYKISRPKFPLNVRNSEHNHPPTTSGIVYIYLPVSPTPTQQVLPYYTPPPPHPAPSAILTIIPAHPKDEISNPTSPRHPGEHPVLLGFLGGWQLPLYMYQVVW